MRPYLVLSAVIFVAATTFGQQPFSHPSVCLYGCGPYIPLAVTPEISLQSVSPNPVGASNATTGLIAGATNSTLSQIQGSTSSEYAVAVWYQGGAPLITPQVRLLPETVGREGHIVHEGMMHEAMMHEAMEEHGKRTEARGSWTYYTGHYPTSEPEPSARTGKKATHVYTNDDVARENDKNGNFKYDGKSGKIQ
jgi:hypothetical protein